MRAIVGLGASLGAREDTLRLAVQALDALPETQVEAVSRVWASAPVGGVAHRAFRNAAVRLQTHLPPEALLDHCKAIEVRLGRRPARRWADRVLDLDVLLYGEVAATLDGGRLTIPHPRLLERGFALRPAQEVGAALHHPTAGVPLGTLVPPGGGLWPVGVLHGPPLRVARSAAAQ